MNAGIDTFATKELFSFSLGSTLNLEQPQSRLSIGLEYNKILVTVQPADTGSSQQIWMPEAYNTKTWYQISVVANIPRDSIYVYIDGELHAAKEALFEVEATADANSIASSIGANDLGQDDYFVGKLDEARIAVHARSPSWIKLSYENQRERQTVVSLKDNR